MESTWDYIVLGLSARRAPMSTGLPGGAATYVVGYAGGHGPGAPDGAPGPDRVAPADQLGLPAPLVSATEGDGPLGG
jgi:hypothetical protein